MATCSFRIMKMGTSLGRVRFLLLVFWCSLAYVDGQGAKEAVKGTEFWLAFMQHTVSRGYSSASQIFFLYISNPTTSTISATAELKGLTSQSLVQYTIAPGATEEHVIGNEFMLRGATKHNRSVYVTSDDEMHVQAFYQITDELTKSSGGFAVLPKASLDKEYIVATDCSSRNCVVLVLATEAATSVSVQLRIRGTAKASYRNTYYVDGDAITESLDTGESMQVLCYECDMTGTRVDSNKKVAVFSGGELTRVGGGSGKDLVVEQMMPKKTIGRRYVLGSNITPATEETVKVVTIKDGVRFSFGGDCYTSTEERQVFTFHRPSNRIVEVIADDQILVAQFIQAKGSATPDTVMNLAVPYRQWSTSYEVYVPATDPWTVTDSIVLCLLTRRDTILQFTGLQPSKIIQSTRKETQGDFSMVTYKVSGGKLLTVSCASRCQPFLGFLLRIEPYRTSSITLRNQTNKFTPAFGATYAAEITAACEADVTTATVDDVSTLGDVTTQTPTAALATKEDDVSTLGDVTTQTPTAALATKEDDVSTLGDVTTQTPSAAHATTEGDVTTLGDVTTQTTSAAGVQLKPASCCRCVKNPAPSGGVPAVTKEEKTKVEEEAKEAIRKELTEDKKSLSSYARTKISSKDERPSSKFVGYSGIVLFVVVFGFIVGLDVSTFVRFLVESRAKLR